MFLPFMTGPDGILCDLEPIIGDIRGLNNERWSSLDASNCRTKIELFSAWERLVREAQDCTNFLEDSVEELTGPLSSDFKSFGSGSEDGSTRSAVIHQLENLHFLSLSKSLQHPPDLNFRPARIFSQADKLSQAWISALPGAFSHIPSLEFSEIMNTSVPPLSGVTRVFFKLNYVLGVKYRSFLRF